MDGEDPGGDDGLEAGERSLVADIAMENARKNVKVVLLDETAAIRLSACLCHSFVLHTAKFNQLLRGHWSCQSVTLQYMATEIFQDLRVLHCLHALGDNVDIL